MNIMVSPKHRVVGVPYRTDIFNLFPHAKEVTFQGRPTLIVPHRVDETRMLRNLGYEIPAPITSQYDWEGGKPFDVQIKTAAMLTMNSRAFVLNGMGTGKTKASLWSWRYLNKTGQAGSVLVVAPLSTLNFTWAREIFATLPDVTYQVLHGSKARRLKKLAEPADVYIINHDGVNVIKEALEKRPDIDTLILDELAVYRNGTSTRTKVMRDLVKHFKWAWGMTGSPTPNAPTDAWAQCSIINPANVPRYFGRFRDQVMHKVSQFRWVAKPDCLDVVHDVMQPAVRYTLDDVVELPDLIERTIDIEMGETQAKVYKQMEDQAFTMVQSKEITAVNAGAVLNKLLQISTGYVYNREGEICPLDNDLRLDALVDWVNSTDRKVIVFVPFIHALKGVAERLTHEGMEVATVSGSTPRSERDELFAVFQNTSKVRVLVAHPQCMSHGLTLTAADTIIWFAPTTSLEIFEQANARIRRVGQKHKQQILMFQATKAERKIYSTLRSKQKIQNTLLDMFAETTQ